MLAPGPNVAVRTRVWLLLWLLLVPLLGYGQLLSPGVTPYSTGSDFILYHMANKWALYESVRSGHGLPLWQSHQLSGMSALTNPQYLYTYPLHFLFYLLPPTSAVGPTMYLHQLVLAGGYIALGRALSLSLFAQLIMATAGLYCFKLILALFAGWLAVQPVLSLLPWLLAATAWIFQRPDLRRSMVLAALMTLTLLGGPPQLPYYMVLLIAPVLLWTILRLLRTSGPDRQRGRRIFAALLGAAALAMGACAYMLVPLGSVAPLLSRDIPSFDKFRGSALRPEHLIGFLWPESRGSPLDGSYFELWEVEPYFGLIPLLLAIAAMVIRPRHRTVQVLGGLFLGSVLLSLDTPLLQVLFHVPGARLFRQVQRLLFLSALFGTALAGFGADALREQAPRWWPRRGPAISRILPWLLLLSMTAEGALQARRYVQMLRTDAVLPSPDYRATLRQDRGLFRVAPVYHGTLNPGWAGPFGLQIITGFDSINLQHYLEYVQIMQSGTPYTAQQKVWVTLDGVRRPDMLSALNVKYLLSPFALPGTTDELRELRVFDQQPYYTLNQGLMVGPMHLYQNQSCRERAFFVRRAVEVPDDESMRQAVLRDELRSIAVVLRPGQAQATQDFPPNEQAQVDIEEAYPGRLRLRARTAAARYLVISEVWHPGWRGTVDGQPAPVYRADLALSAMWVPAGEHSIELRFVPPNWGLSLSITGAALLLMAGLWGWSVQRERAARRAAHLQP